MLSKETFHNAPIRPPSFFKHGSCRQGVIQVTHAWVQEQETCEMLIIDFTMPTKIISAHCLVKLGRQQWLCTVNNDSAGSNRHCNVNNGPAVSTMVLQCQQWICSVNNGSAVSTVVLQCQQWFCNVNNGSAVSTMALQCQQWFCNVNNGSAMSTMVLQCQQWFCSVNNGSAVSTMVLQCQQWFCNVNNGSAVSTMVLQCQQWFCNVNNGSAMSTMVLQCQQWFCSVKMPPQYQNWLHSVNSASGVSTILCSPFTLISFSSPRFMKANDASPNDTYRLNGVNAILIFSPQTQWHPAVSVTTPNGKSLSKKV